MNSLTIKCPSCFALHGQPCVKIGIPMMEDAAGNMVHAHRASSALASSIKLRHTSCCLCQQPIPSWRLGSDYCSASCWEAHHGAETDHVDQGPEPEEME